MGKPAEELARYCSQSQPGACGTQRTFQSSVWTPATHTDRLFASMLPFHFVQLFQLCITPLLSLCLPLFMTAFSLSPAKHSGQSPAPMPRTTVLFMLCCPRACVFPTTRSLFGQGPSVWPGCCSLGVAPSAKPHSLMVSKVK